MLLRLAAESPGAAASAEVAVPRPLAPAPGQPDLAPGTDPRHGHPRAAPAGQPRSASLSCRHPPPSSRRPSATTTAPPPGSSPRQAAPGTATPPGDGDQRRRLMTLPQAAALRAAADGLLRARGCHRADHRPRHPAGPRRLRPLHPPRHRHGRDRLGSRGQRPARRRAAQLRRRTQNPPPVGQPRRPGTCQPRRRDHRHRRPATSDCWSRPFSTPPDAASSPASSRTTSFGSRRVTERSRTNRAPSGRENTRQLNTRSCQYSAPSTPASTVRAAPSAPCWLDTAATSRCSGCT